MKFNVIFVKSIMKMPACTLISYFHALTKNGEFKRVFMKSLYQEGAKLQ